MSTLNPDAAPIFAALGDPTRLAIIARLSDGEPRSISALSAGGALTRQAVTRHLHVLHDAGLVESRRIGREARFAFRPDQVKAARSYLDEVSMRWDEALERLRAFVED